jgi:flagellar hook-basal body complex protein FliE
MLLRVCSSGLVHQRIYILLIDSVTKIAAGLKTPAISSYPLKVDGEGFSGALTNALRDVSKLQKTSGELTKAFTLESTTVSLEEVMLAGVKSNIGFQSALQTRNRLVQAYSDVMNMQI